MSIGSLSAASLPILLSLAPARAGAQGTPPCDFDVDVGFSTSPIDSDVPFDGVIGHQGNGEIVVEVPAGAVSATTLVYVDVVSQLPDDGIFGWTLSIALHGDLELLSTRRVFPPPQLSRPRYPAIVDPARNQGQRGVTEYVTLEPRGDPDYPEGPLPPVMTRSLLSIEVGWSDTPLPAGGRTASLRFEDGLVGHGEPFPNTFSLNAGAYSARPCNLDLASVTVRFVEAALKRFVRGNANGDRKVDIADAIWMLNAILGGPPATCRDAADANGDGTLSITDPIWVIDGQFFGGRPLPAPFPDCGTDPSGGPGPLGCEDTSGCP